METSERMMIVGLALQGLLANPSHSTSYGHTPESEAAQLAANVRLAHQYADALDPKPPAVLAELIAAHTKTCWAVLRAYAAGREPYAEAVANDAEGVGFVFERVSRWVADPIGHPTDIEDALIRAVVVGE